MPPLPRAAVDIRSLVGTPTGLARFVAELLSRLLERHEFRWLGMAHREPRDGDAWRRRGLQICSDAAPLGVLWQQWHLPRRLRSEEVDLFWSPLFTLPPRLHVPAVISVHDLTAVLYPETHRLKTRLSLLPFLERSLVRADRVVTSAETIARQLAFHFPAAAGKIAVVPHGVGPEFRPAPADEIERLRHELETPNGYLLYVGTLEPRKNLHLLLDAWEAAAQDEPELPPLLLAGPYGWHSRLLLRRLRELRPRGVRALGEQTPERLVQLYQAARLFLYPSVTEGFGLPPLEAMACGVPTLVASASPLPEVTGDGALHLDPLRAAEWKGAILRLVSDPDAADALARQGRVRAADFTWERSAAAMSALFRELL